MPLKKMTTRLRTSFCFVLLLTLTLHSVANAAERVKNKSSSQTTQLAASAPVEKLKVGILMIQPFGYEDEGGYFDGFAYKLWSRISEENNFHSTYVSLGENIDEAVHKIATGEIDVAIGPIGILSHRIVSVNFTQPIFLGEYVLFGKKSSVKFWKQFDALFKNNSIWIFLGLIFMYVIYLHVFWYYERRHQASFKNKSYKHAITDLIWNSMLSRSFRHPFYPSTTVLKLLSLFWNTLLASAVLAAFSGLSASFISQLQQEKAEFSSMKKVGNRPIAVFGGEAAIEDATNAGLNVVYTPTSLEEMIELVDSGNAAGGFMLRGGALSYLDKHHRDDLYISPIRFHKIPLGFAISYRLRNLLPGINASLLKMSESGKKREICRAYEKYLLENDCNW